MTRPPARRNAPRLGEGVISMNTHDDDVRAAFLAKMVAMLEMQAANGSYEDSRGLELAAQLLTAYGDAR